MNDHKKQAIKNEFLYRDTFLSFLSSFFIGDDLLVDSSFKFMFIPQPFLSVFHSFSSYIFDDKSDHLFHICGKLPSWRRFELLTV